MLLKSILAGAAAAVLFAGPALAECKVSSALSACKGCHVFEADKPSRPTGPNLADVYGRAAGTRSDFTKWSEAMTAAKATNLVWSEDNLKEYLEDPKGFFTKVNGSEKKHGMFFNLKDEGKRKDAIKALKELKECK